MTKDDELTYGIPRFLSFIELGYLLEAAKGADFHLAKKIDDTDSEANRDLIGNINATRQSLLRAVFVSAYAILEQHLDEIVNMERSRNNILISPSDLKDRGINRSLKYSKKVLGNSIDTDADHWKDLMLLQDVRNHLVHYGPDFDQSSEHEKRFKKFQKIEFVSLRPMICFSVEQIERVFELFMVCVQDFSNLKAKDSVSIDY